ncbi:putative six-bladed beta-propellerlike protein [Diplodia seriata]|uniref:Putative six-bladed beta-propellerlike protein n=1 Tax=Diplodia seriata TaxID=420778 RepID=A0A0G2HIQ7_9PEZI|nr:putative six-bladed beta-propellerlike protein [Diplodia seriata]
MKLSTTIRNAAAFLAMLKPTSATPYPVRTVYQFADNGTWIENIAVRPNGNLLVTLLAPSADLYEIVLSSNHSAEAGLVRRFAAYEGLTGIAETAPDVFAVLAGNYSTPSTASWSLWEADFTTTTTTTTTVNELVPSIPNALVLNGMTTTAGPLLQQRDDDVQQLLISDSTAGHVLRIANLLSSPSPDDPDDDIAVFLADDRTMSPPNASLPTGVNGIEM